MGRNYDIITSGSCSGSQVDFIKGDLGPEGKSAFQIAKEHGFYGNEEQWLKSLIGRNGKDAYEIAVKHGFCGTEKDWLCSLEGKDAYEIAVECGFCGSKDKWLRSLHGENAYDLAKHLGFEGTLEEYLEYLKGESTYEIAVKYGYKGSEEDWIMEITDKAITSVEATGVDTADSNDYIKFVPQLLSEEEQAQARANIGLNSTYGPVEADDIDDMVSCAMGDSIILSAVKFTDQNLSVDQIKQAQKNINVYDKSVVDQIKGKVNTLKVWFGSKSNLLTKAKENIVAAVNELWARPTVLSGESIPTNDKGRNGDVYVQYGTEKKTYIKVNGVWK